MAERKTEQTWNPNTKSWDTRTVFDQGQAKEYHREASEAEAAQGTKRLFSKEEPKEKKPSEMSLGELAAYNRKKRERAAQEAGQKKALSGM